MKVRRRGKRQRLTAYAAANAIGIAITTVPTVTTALLTKWRANGMSDQTSTNAVSVGRAGRHRNVEDRSE